jgi:hypothetical protein
MAVRVIGYVQAVPVDDALLTDPVLEDDVDTIPRASSQRRPWNGTFERPSFETRIFT